MHLRVSLTLDGRQDLLVQEEVRVSFLFDLITLGVSVAMVVIDGVESLSAPIAAQIMLIEESSLETTIGTFVFLELFDA